MQIAGACFYCLVYCDIDGLVNFSEGCVSFFLNRGIVNSFALLNKTLDVSLHIDYAKNPTTDSIFSFA